ncbi:MAG TPA: DinB family protein [Candidatus Dormibacteraeota bacterium]
MSVPRALAETVAMLERTPAVARTLLEGLPEDWLDTPDTADGWRPRDVIGHLISAELTNWRPRIETILAHGTTQAFPDFDRFAHVERDAGVSLAALLARFAELRATNLAWLAERIQSADDLDRAGLHPALGEVTLGQLLATWTVHDLDHLNQLFSALAGSRDAAVGTWKQFLGILLRRDAPTA